MDIHDTLAEAIAMVEHGKQRAFGAGVVVDRERMLQLLNHARSALPEEILAAASILAQRAQIMAAASDEADQIRGSAELELEQIQAAAVREAEHLRAVAMAEADGIRDHAEQERLRQLDEHEIIHQAVERGDEIVSRAQHQAAAMRGEVDAYVDAKLAAIATTLSRALDAVEAGRRKVRVQDQAMPDEAVALP